MKRLQKPYKIVIGVLGAVLASVTVAVGVKKFQNAGAAELASTPNDLSWNSWKRAFVETKNAFTKQNLSMLAAGVAYGGTLAFFPLVVASVAIASIVLEPEQIRSIVEGLSTYLPKDIASLLSAQLVNALNNNSANLIIAISAILLALFGVSGAMNSLVNALNICYDINETRSFIKVRLVSLGLTSLMVVGMIIVLPLIILGEGILRAWNVPDILIVLFSVLRWALLGVVMVIGLAVIYRYAPNRLNVKWQWVSWGAIIATILWLVATALFFVYVQYFGDFSQSYSLFAGIIVLMMWLNFSGLIVLVGAEINHQLEKRTILPTK